jgi:hypothetical protein
MERWLDGKNHMYLWTEPGKGPTLTLSPCQKTDILLSDSLLAFMPEENDLYKKSVKSERVCR